MMELKIPFYNVLNMLLIGVLFVIGVVVILHDDILTIMKHELIEIISNVPDSISIICFLGVTYGVGMIINRIGSVFIEPIFRKIGWISFRDDYRLFNESQKINSSLSMLSREYALSRSSFTLFSILILLSLFVNEWRISVFFFIIMIVYVLSWRKYAERIVALMCEDGDDI